MTTATAFSSQNDAGSRASTASYWKNFVLVVVLVLESKGLYCRNGGNELSKVRSFIILGSREGLTSFNKDNSAIFSNEKKYNEAQFRGGCLFFENTRQKLSVKASLSSLG